MNYVLKPSLEHIALVKLATTLWNQSDAKDLSKFCFPANSKHLKSKWVKIEAIAVKKVAKLPLPKELKEKILCIIKPIGFQISKWEQFHDRGCNLRVDLPEEFSWTPQGTIDSKKTAEVMIKDESIDITTRYKLACIYCLEDDVLELWEKMPEDCRKSFYNQEDPIHVMQKELVVLWTYQMKGEVDKMESMIEERMERYNCSPSQYAFEVAASNGNKVATEYFLQKLSSAEREESLMKTAESVLIWKAHYTAIYTYFLRESYSLVFCFLFSHLNEKQQMKVLRNRPGQVLACFMDWPLQTFFMKTANRMWNFLPKRSYNSIVFYFIYNLVVGFKDDRKLFHEFWEQSPNDYKRYVLRDSNIYFIVSQLFKMRDEATIRLIFQDATPEDKKSIIYHDDSQDICKKLLHGNQKGLLKYFIKECLPLKDEVVKFKKYYVVNVFLVEEFMLRKFLRVCDEIICEFKKRKSVEGECSRAKRV